MHGRLKWFVIPLHKMRKVVITGGSGFIARYFIEKLPHFNLVNLDIRAPAFESHATFMKGDIRNQEDVEKAMAGADMLIHLAAMHHDFGISEEEYFNTNVNGARLLADAAERFGAKTIVNFSSVAVYGKMGDPGPTNEETPTTPTNAYGQSKLAAESIFRDWVKGDPSRILINVRPTVVFGPWNLANVLNLIQAIDKGYFVHVGKGDNIKSIAYVENLVDATLFALEKTQSGECLFNYSDGPPMTIRQTSELQASLLGKRIRFNLPLWLMLILSKPFDLFIWLSGKNLKISSARIRKLCTQTWHSANRIREMGFVPAYSIHYGMDQMIRWYRKPIKND